LLGWDPQSSVFWSYPYQAKALARGVLLDDTSITNFGIILGALIASGFAGRFEPTLRIPAKHLLASVIGGLLLVLWYPGLVQWAIENLPIPAKARLQGIVLRISRATAAYRDKKRLVLGMLLMSFAVHFTTAAMYYFMAIAVGAGADAEFWPIAFGSSIQIFATVIGPTIGGLGVREAAQLLTIGSLIGPGAAIVSDLRLV